MVGQGAFAFVDGGGFILLHAQRGEQHLRHDAFGLDGVARRRVVLRGGEFDRAAVIERDDGLHAALAEGRLADDDCAALVLQGTGNDFRARRRAFVHQDDDGQSAQDVAVAGDVLFFLVGVAAAHVEDGAAA